MKRRFSVAALGIEPGTLTASSSSSPFVLAAQHLSSDRAKHRHASFSLPSISSISLDTVSRYANAQTRGNLSRNGGASAIFNIPCASTLHGLIVFRLLIIASCNVYLRKRHFANNTSYNFAYRKMYGAVRARRTSNTGSKFLHGGFNFWVR